MKDRLEYIVEKVNEKYGITKRWRAKSGNFYCYIDRNFQVSWNIESGYFIDDENYKNGNYLETETEAKKYAEYMKQKSLEWHEKRENS